MKELFAVLAMHWLTSWCFIVAMEGLVFSDKNLITCETFRRK
jgi:hypothetical protein